MRSRDTLSSRLALTLFRRTHNITYPFINMTTERIMSTLTKKWTTNAYIINSSTCRRFFRCKILKQMTRFIDKNAKDQRAKVWSEIQPTNHFIRHTQAQIPLGSSRHVSTIFDTFDMSIQSSSSCRACRAVLFDKFDIAKIHGLDTSNASSRVET